jgi:predicted amidohydrolase
VIEAELRSLRRRFPWVRLAVIPELAVHGIDVAHAEEEGGPTERQFAALARELDLWLVPGSFFQRHGEHVRNVTPIIDNRGEVIARYAKMFPFKPYEAGVTPGTELVTFDIPEIGRIGISNCYDMWFPETVRSLAMMGAEVILHPSLTNTIDRDVEMTIARANAAIHQCFFLDINGAGQIGNGRSGAYGPGGTIIYQAGGAHEVLAFEFDLAEVRRVRERGWHGLGQTLKSFRDSDADFPLLSKENRRTPAMTALGTLEKPGLNTTSG